MAAERVDSDLSLSQAVAFKTPGTLVVQGDLDGLTMLITSEGKNAFLGECSEGWLSPAITHDRAWKWQVDVWRICYDSGRETDYNEKVHMWFTG